MKTIILTGGGTAGHVTPHLNMLPDLEKHFDKIEYIGSKTGIEKTLIKKEGIPYHEITTTKFQRRKILKNFKIPFELIKGKREAKELLRKIKPNVIFSKGGFVSVPVVLAAKSLHIPVIAHESDITPGLANRFVAKKCKKVFTTFKITAQKLKNGEFCGAPIKPPLSISKEVAKQKLEIQTTKPILLVTGGSSGAKALNNAVAKALKNLTKTYFVYHITGKGNRTNFVSKSYKEVEYSSEMPLIMRAADYAITRGGSNTIFELAANQIPMIIVPLPKGTSRGDQVKNAEYFRENGYSITLNQQDLSTENLEKTLEILVQKRDKIRDAQRQIKDSNACKMILDTLIKM